MRPEAPATTTRPSARDGSFSGKRRLERDLDAGQGGRDGQPVFASPAMRAKSSADSPGTTALTFKCEPVMPVPGMKVTDAVVSMLSGGVPLPASACERAMLKHEECAAASSSSGVVTDEEPSLRAFQLTANGPWFELSRAISPDPSVREPFQLVDASLVTLMCSSCRMRAAWRRCASEPRRARAPTEPVGLAAGAALRRWRGCR
jgi:hypothetical protein